MGMQATELLKFKPKMEDEYDVDLLRRMKFLAMELRTHSPFFGVLASEMWIAGPSKSVPTIGVSERGVLVYNEEYILSLEPGELIAVLTHEALHPALDFWARFKGLNFKVANWAHDFVINDIIVRSLSEISFTKSTGQTVRLNIKLPPNVLHDLKYRDMSGEGVYLDLIEGINKKAEAAKERFRAAMTDPIQKAAWDRQEAINKELRESLKKGFEQLSKSQTEANAKTRIANPELQKRMDEFDDVLSDLESIKWEDKGHEAEKEPKSPGNDQDMPQDSDDSSNELTGESEKDPTTPTEGDGQQASDDSQKTPFDELKDQMNKSISDYADREHERIGDEYDGKDPKTTQDQNLDDLQKDLDKAADEYVDKVTNPNQPKQEGQQGQPSPEKAQDGNESDQPQSPQDSAEANSQNSPGEGQSADDTSMPSSEPGEPGSEGQPDGNGKGSNELSHGEGSPAGGMDQGQSSPGESGMEQPGQSGGSSGGTQPGSPTSGSGEQKSEANARADVEDALEQVKKELARALSGKDGGTPGIDPTMASGNDMMEAGAQEQAMREMAKELGVNDLDGDITLDCDDIEGNPYAHETPDETASRKRQMFNRAIQEDLQNGGNTMGRLPAWLQKDINGILYPEMSFDQKMTRFIGNYGRETKRTFAKANRRNTFFKDHLIRRGRVVNDAIMYVIQDTSGSMMTAANADNLRKSMGLIERLANNKGMEVVVIQCDVGVTQRMNTREALDMINKKQFNVKGLGGSSFVPAFEEIWQEMSKSGGSKKGNLICVFTDGEISVPAKPPMGIRQQVLWITNPGQNAPTKDWGEHLVMR